MRTTISKRNPFGADRYGYCWETINALSLPGKHLDFGSYDGHVAYELLRHEVVSQAVAADVVDVEANFRLRHQRPPPDNLEFVPGSPLPLPFGDGYFDTISLLDVLEHVADQDSLLRELHRLLAPSGRIIVTVPKRHCFSILDMGNWKFRFPRIHKLYYSTRHSKEEYWSRYVDPTDGLVGDIEIAKSWHQHFTEADLVEQLGRNGLGVVSLDGSGLFARPLALLRVVTLGGFSRLLTRAVAHDAIRFSSTHLFCTARRVNEET